MSTFLATSNEEDLLTHGVSDEALEAASGNEVVARYTLANCTGDQNVQADLSDLISKLSMRKLTSSIFAAGLYLLS
jgi:hypothetical protein